MKVLVAIDPGASGAIAVRDSQGRVFVDAMPDTLWDIYETINLYRVGLPSRDLVSVVIEDAGYHVQGNNASASCKFARHCGHLEMALTAARFSWEAILPQKWMKSFGTLPKEKKDRKNAIKEKMQRLYPQIKVTLANADALALLTWAITRNEVNA